jgi:CRP-like cAMP-binding protein
MHMALRPENYLLQQLSEGDFELLRADLRPVPLVHGDALYEPGDAVDAVIFPESGLLSVITIMASGATSETSMVGRDSAFGFVEASGSGHVNSRVIVQIAGLAWVAPASRFRAAFEGSGTLRTAIQSDIEMQLAEGRQSLACNSLHAVDQRLARWILDCQEKAGCGDTLALTQDFLRSMLSVQRSTVSRTTSLLESEGMLKQRRGSLHITDRKALESRACECRTTIARLRRSITPNAPDNAR